MDALKNIFQRKTANFEKLAAYGFSKETDGYSYTAVLSGNGFLMTVRITEQGDVRAVVTDPAFGEPYTLHLVDGALGSFVGGVRAEYERVLTDIAERCFEVDVFKSELSKKAIAYIRDTYGDALEYLWQKFPDNAVVRRKDNRKWYAVLLTVSRRRLGFDSDERVEIIDLRMPPEEIEKQVDGVRLLPGYHMNKKHWVTVCLDGSVSFAEICRKIDESYRLAKK